MDNRNKDRFSHTEQGIDTKRKKFYQESKKKVGSKVSRMTKASWQKLRDNVAQFKKEPKLMSLILVWQREEQPQDQ